MKTYSGSRGIAPLLTSALDGRKWSTSRPGRFTPPRYPLNRKLDWPHSQSARFVSIRIKDRPRRDVATIRTTPSRHLLRDNIEM
jgi:hypothetical protein